MFDNRIPLSKGDKLYTDTGVVYTISSSEYGFGGSSLLYSATSDRIERTFVIKECYPVFNSNLPSYQFIRGTDGIVCATGVNKEGSHAYLQKRRKELEKESMIGQRIAAATGRVIAPWEKEKKKKILFLFL